MIDQHAVSAVGSPLQQRHQASRQQYEPQRHVGQNLIGNHTSLPPQRSESTLLPISICVKVVCLYGARGRVVSTCCSS